MPDLSLVRFRDARTCGETIYNPSKARTWWYNLWIDPPDQLCFAKQEREPMDGFIYGLMMSLLRQTRATKTPPGTRDVKPQVHSYWITQFPHRYTKWDIFFHIFPLSLLIFDLYPCLRDDISPSSPLRTALLPSRWIPVRIKRFYAIHRQ
jgi:hypothetical protein